MSKEKSPAKSSGQTKAPSIASDKQGSPSVKVKGLDLYGKNTSDGSKPSLSKRK